MTVGNSGKRLVPSSNWKAMRSSHTTAKQKAAIKTTIAVKSTKARVVKRKLTTPVPHSVKTPVQSITADILPPTANEESSTTTLSSEVSSQLAILSSMENSSLLFTEEDLSTDLDTSSKLGRYISLDCEMVKGKNIPSNQI
jgi:hypothetical protein